MEDLDLKEIQRLLTAIQELRAMRFVSKEKRIEFKTNSYNDHVSSEQAGIDMAKILNKALDTVVEKETEVIRKKLNAMTKN